MLWDAAEAALESHIRTAWAAGAYPTVPLVFTNNSDDQTEAADAARFVAINIEGVFAEKSIYGGTNKRMSVESGLVYFHVFVEVGIGKATALSMNVALAAMLELQLVSTSIYLAGANPPSPVEYGDQETPNTQPGGNYYRCSGSVPFIVTGTR
jgi:hypothetical protein